MPAADASILSNDRARGYWALLIGIPLLLAIVTLSLVPLSAPTYNYLQDAQDYAATGHIIDTTFPVEFTWFAGLSMKAFGGRGPEILQTLLYLLNVLVVWAVARKAGAGPRNAIFAALATALYPQLILSVTKVWDVELAVLLLALLLLCTLSILRDGIGPWTGLMAGAVIGLSSAQRPNMLFLFALPLYFVLVARASWPRKLVSLATGCGVAALLLFGINTLAHGSFFLEQNGAYNLVQGHNEFARETMLQNLNSEPTIVLIMQADGLDPTHIDESDPKLQKYFKQRAIAYIRTHPGEEVKIAVVKFWTVFRPNTRVHGGVGAAALAIVAVSLIFPAWLILLILRAARTGLDRLDWTFVAAFILYVLPFIITCADPRYQIAIEVCLLAHIARMTAGGNAFSHS